MSLAELKLPEIVIQIGREYEALEENRAKLTQDCTKLRQSIEQQISHIRTLNNDFLKLKQEYQQKIRPSFPVMAPNAEIDNIQTSPSDDQAQREWKVTPLLPLDQIPNKIQVALLAEILDISVVCSTAFSPDGQHIAIGSNNTLRIYNVDQCKFTIEYTLNESDESTANHIRSLTWTRDNKRVICGGEDWDIRVLDVPEGNLVTCFEGGKGEVFQIQCSNSSDFFASVTGDGELTIWSLQDFSKIASMVKGTTDRKEPTEKIVATSLSISEDDSIIAVGYNDNTVVLWDVETHEIITQKECHEKGVYSVKFLPGLKRLATSALDSTVKIWDLVETSKGGLSLSLWKTLQEHENYVLTLAADPTGQWLISGSKDLTIKISSIETGQMLYSIKAHTNSVISVAFNHNGTMFCSGSGDHSVLVWSITPETSEDDIA